MTTTCAYCEQPKRNQLFGFDIPKGHLALLDLAQGTIALYQHWRKVGNPEAYLRNYWLGADTHVSPDVPA